MSSTYDAIEPEVLDRLALNDTAGGSAPGSAAGGSSSGSVSKQSNIRSSLLKVKFNDIKVSPMLCLSVSAT